MCNSESPSHQVECQEPVGETLVAERVARDHGVEDRRLAKEEEGRVDGVAQDALHARVFAQVLARRELEHEGHVGAAAGALARVALLRAPLECRELVGDDLRGRVDTVVGGRRVSIVSEDEQQAASSQTQREAGTARSDAHELDSMNERIQPSAGRVRMCAYSQAWDACASSGDRLQDAVVAQSGSAFKSESWTPPQAWVACSLAWPSC